MIQRFVPALAAIVLMPLAAAAQSTDATLKLAERIASQWGAPSKVYLGATPPGLPAVPLPAATLLGSVSASGPAVRPPAKRNGAIVASGGQPAHLFFDAPNRAGVLEAYTRALANAGFTVATPGFPFSRGGFVPTRTMGRAYCGPGNTMIMISESADPTALDVMVMRTEAGEQDMMCRPDSPFREMMRALPQSPLPSFSEPPGMRVEQSGPASDGTTTAAQISSPLGLTQTFDAFAKQLRDAGWANDAPVSSPNARTQTFRKRVEDVSYVAMLTMYVLEPNTYIAIADVTPQGGRRSSSLRMFSTPE